ncbi:hypothetical protein C9374_010078 [Naegleria lovaniensis]|uniref:Protein kinase domain-containing protein n=1 Tax=Naegleria lovaniensis TaxID=51637 RepID=A0AA88GI97_NAELO|nr:uncharacterized protein C9374_010078 [Naegleria lovaniensis]KAG2375074.1 hypothetical protein C9374_010078 [Naegleria lovaniensis]
MVLERWQELFNTSPSNTTWQDTEELNVLLLDDIHNNTQNCGLVLPQSTATSPARKKLVIVSEINNNTLENSYFSISCQNSFVLLSEAYQLVELKYLNLRNMSFVFSLHEKTFNVINDKVRTVVTITQSRIENVKHLFDGTGEVNYPSLLIHNSNIIDSTIECGYHCSVLSTSVQRRMSSVRDDLVELDFMLLSEVFAYFNDVHFRLIFDIPTMNHTTPASCSDSVGKHAFISGTNTRSVTMINSSMVSDKQCIFSGRVCSGYSTINCIGCNHFSLRNTTMDTVGNVVYKTIVSDSTIISGFYLVDVELRNTKCSHVAIQGANNVKISRSNFVDNLSVDGWPILEISDADTVEVKNANFTNNDGGALFLQNIGNVNIQDSLFHRMMGPAIRYLDIQQYSSLDLNAFVISNTVFSNNNAQHGAAINSNSLGVTILNCTFSENTVSRHGGSIYITEQSENSNKVMVINNTQFFDGRNVFPSSFGGFIYATSEVGSVSIYNSTFSHASSEDSGGCIYLDVPSTVLNSVYTSSCYSKYDGGGIFFEKGTVVMQQSKVSHCKSEGYGGALYMKAGVYAYISQSTFEFSHSAQGRAGGLYGERKTGFTIDNCLFISNTATIRGAAIYHSRGNDLTILNSRFIGNRIYYSTESSYAEQGPSGAAIFVYSARSFLMSNSTFEGNAIDHNPEMEGRGGALLLTPSVSSTQLSNVTFIKNSAESGGALYIYNLDFPSSKFSLDNLRFIGNRAIRQGGAIFLVNTVSTAIADLCKNSYFDDNYAELYGDNYASTPKVLTLSNNGWMPEQLFYQFPLDMIRDSLVDSKVFKSEPKTLYSGQKLSLKIDAYDLFNERMENIRGVDIDLILTSSLNSTSKEGKVYYATTFSNDTATFSNITIFGNLNSTLYLYFSCKSVIREFSIPVQILPNCPVFYNYDITECTPNYNVQSVFLIIIGSVVAFVFTFIVLMTGCCYYFLRKKLKELKRREQAEEDLQRRLLQYQLISSKNSLKESHTSISSGAQEKTWVIKPEDLKIKERIGQGGESVIFNATWMNNIVAVKRIHVDTSALEDDEVKTETINTTFEKEAYILSTLRFPNIVTFYGIAITPSDRFIVIEYCSGGNLRKKIHESKKKKHPLSIAQKLNYLLDIAYGMKYLHSLDPPLIHRDLKPENILIAENNVCKICDFGLGREFSSEATTIMTSQIGTPTYIAPEIILDQHYTEKCDVYSFSIIMWELLFEEKAFSKESFDVMREFMEAHKDLISSKPYEPIDLGKDTNIDDRELGTSTEKVRLLDIDEATQVPASPTESPSPQIEEEPFNSFKVPSFNMLSMTKEIVNGLRPIIPFRIKKTFNIQSSSDLHENMSSSSRKFMQLDPLLKQYVRENLLEKEKGTSFFLSSKSMETKVCLIVKEYCELMIQCWDEDAKRPSFSEICERLSNCAKILS